MASTDGKPGTEEREKLRREMDEYFVLGRQASTALGARNWTLLRSYGRMMSGPYGGLYVSGIPLEEARRLVEELGQGRSIDVHLMHRHRSGNYESSTLSFTGGQFVMHFADRDEIA